MSQGNDVVRMTVETAEPQVEWQYVPNDVENRWRRFLIAQIGPARLRGFWGQLGQYLQYLKQRRLRFEQEWEMAVTRIL